jgi:hypothetical protein
VQLYASTTDEECKGVFVVAKIEAWKPGGVPEADSRSGDEKSFLALLWIKILKARLVGIAKPRE